MPVDEFRARAERLRTAMAERDLDALLLYGANLNGCGHPTWLSNYIVKLPFAALVLLPRDGDPALMFQGATRGRSAAQATTWIEDVRPCWNIGETCLAALEDRHLTGARLGLAGLPRLMPHADWRTLAAGLAGAALVDAEDLVVRCRAIKSDREVAQIRRASAIVAAALESVLHSGSFAGESELAAHIMRTARIRGAEDIRLLIFKSGDADAAFRPVEDAALTEGETIAVLLSASRERYWSEAIRTVRVGGDRFEPTESQAADRFAALVDGLRPGTSIPEWSSATLARMTNLEAAAVRTYGLGHGIGIEPEEWPALSDTEETAIAPGMCFTVRTVIESDGGLIWQGDTLVVP